MGLIKITFDGSSVSAKQDADINHHVTGLVPAGIIRGLGSDLSLSASNNYITFQAGYVQIYGRRIYVEAGSQVYVSLDSTKSGYVIIDVNLATNTALLTTVEGSSYPTLIQNDLSKTGTRYQMPIARYTKTATSLTIDTSFQRTFIETPLSVADSGYQKAKTYVNENYSSWARSYADESTASTWKYRIDSWDWSDGMILVNINDCVIIPVSGNFINNHSNGLLYYMYDGVSYRLGVSKVASDAFMISTSTSSHKVKSIVCIR